MRREWMLVVGGFVAGVLVTTAWSPRLDAQDRKTETKDLLKLDLGAWCPGKEVLISQLTNAHGGSVEGAGVPHLREGQAGDRAGTVTRSRP